MLKSEHIFLRGLNKSDAEIMLKWENDTENWIVSGTKKPFTKEEIREFVTTKQSLTSNQQIRYVICLSEINLPIGTLDLFEFDVQKKSVGIGVLIAEKKHRNRGFALETLKITVVYCRNELQLVNLFCNIQKENTTSIRLFEKCGFQFIEERILNKEAVNYYELKL